MPSKRKPTKKKGKGRLLPKEKKRRTDESSRNDEVFRQLIENPTLLDGMDGEQMLPVIRAAISSGREDVVRVLLNHGLDPNGILPDGYSCLHIAASLGRVKVVRVLLEAGAIVDHRGSIDVTPLHYAAQGCHDQVVRELLKAKADPNAVSEQGWTPLGLSAVKHDTNSVLLLLEDGADPNARVTMGLTPLMLTCQKGDIPIPRDLIKGGASKFEGSKTNIRIAEALIKAGADVNSVNDKGYSALWFAVLAKSFERVKLLLDHGARISRDVLIRSAERGDVGILELLLQHSSNINADPELAAEMLVEACFDSNPMMVEILLGQGCDPNSRNPERKTPLTQAVAARKKENVTILLAHGADPNLPGPGGRAPLSLAHADTAAVLLDSGASLEVVDEVTGRNVLHWAIEDQHTDSLELFLERGAKTELVDKDGYTPLILAAFEGNFKAVKLLVEAEANVNHPTRDGRTAIDFAVKPADKDIREFLRKHGGRTVQEIHPGAEMTRELREKMELDQLVASEIFTAATEGDLERLRGAVLVADDVDFRDDMGRTPFMVAVLNERLKSADLLIEEGADINAKDNRGLNVLTIATNLHRERAIEYLEAKGCEVQEIEGGKRKRKAAPEDLFTAARNRHVKAAKRLLEEKHDPNQFDPTGRNTPLLIAVKNADAEMVALFLEHSADPDLCDPGNMDTPLIIASREGSIQIVELLIRAGADVNKQGYQGVTALMLAIQKSHWNIVDLLLNAGAKASEIDKKGRDARAYVTKKNDQRQWADILATRARERPGETALAWPRWIEEQKSTFEFPRSAGGVIDSLLRFYTDYLSKLSALEKSPGAMRREPRNKVPQVHLEGFSVLEKTYLPEWVRKEDIWP